MSPKAAQCTGPSWTSRVPSGTSRPPLPVSPRASLGLGASLGFELGLNLTLTLTLTLTLKLT